MLCFGMRRFPVYIHMLTSLCLATAAFANQEAPKLDQLFARLQIEGAEDWQQTELAIVNQWSESGSATLDLLLRRAREALATGDARLAVEHATALIEHAPEFAEGWNARATVYFHIGELDLSVRDIRQVLTLNPRHFGALSGLGLILEEVGESQLALEAYQAAHDLNPNRQETIEAIERLNIALGRFEI